MRGLDLGLDRFKFFPAEASGGIRGAEGTVGTVPDDSILSDRRHPCRIAPRNGWHLKSVLCVGGSWLYKQSDSMDAVAGARAKGSGVAHLNFLLTMFD